MAIPYVPQRARFFDKNGSPLSYGRVSFYAAGTDTLKAVYNSNIEEVGNETKNPHRLLNDGYVQQGGVWLGLGKYKIVVESFIGLDPLTNEPKYALVYTMDNIQGDGLPVATALSTAVINTAIELRTILGGEFAVISTLGHSTYKDNGGGFFKWNATSVKADDNGNIFAGLGNPAIGRWERIYNDDALRPEMWGGFPNRSDLTLDGNFTNMIQFAKEQTINKNIHISKGIYYINGSVPFDGDISVVCEAGVRFENNLAGGAIVDVTCSSFEIKGKERICNPYSQGTPTVSFYYNPVDRSQDVYPEWWGLEADSGTDAVLANIVLNSVDAPRALAFEEGVYSLSADIDFSEYLIKFNSGSSIKLSDSAYVFGKVIVDQEEPIISWGLRPTSILMDSNVHDMSWFDFGTTPVDSTLYADLYTMLTENNSKKVVFNWTKGAYTFAAAVSANGHSATHNITGAVLTFSTSPIFGRIGEAAIGSFSLDSTYSPVLLNSEINVAWWGAVPYRTDTGSNSAAFLLAINCAANSGGAGIKRPAVVQVVGEGVYDLANGISAVVPSTQSIGLKGLGIRARSGFTPVIVESTPYILHLEGGAVDLDKIIVKTEADLPTGGIAMSAPYIKAADCSIDINDSISYGLAAYNSDTYSKAIFSNNTFDSSEDDYYGRAIYTKAQDVVMTGNVFYNVSTSSSTPVVFTDGCVKLEYSANTALGNIVESSGGYIFDLRASDSAVIAGNKFSWCELRTLSPNLTISGNSFSVKNLRIDEPVNTLIANNTFEQSSTRSCGINLVTQQTDFLVSGLRIVDNVFKSSGTPSSLRDMITLSGAGTFLASGHNAVIKDNKVDAGYNLKATEWENTYTVDANVLFTSVVNNPDTRLVTLPQPAYAILPYSGVRVVSTVFEDTKDSVGTFIPPTNSYIGESGLTRAYPRPGTSVSTFDMKLNWTGLTEDQPGGLGAVFQTIKYKVKVSEES